MAFDLSKDDILKDYQTAALSRKMSLLGRKEVLGGKAKFGIFGDGKEVAQVALARSFLPGDWRAGYYRDQTWMLAIDSLTPKQFFAQLYADSNLENEPASGGRQMNSHFATRYLDQNGQWIDQTKTHNVAADLSPTAGQMVKLVGLGYASKLYREVPELSGGVSQKFSSQGNEVAFGSIGNASTSEGPFWEAINAAGVLQIPLAMSVWDDGYGISVHARHQTTKESISDILAGFEPDGERKGVKIYKCAGWDYPALVEMYREGVALARERHIPVLFHITEMTQPQGHSTSGSHERYKSDDRMKFEETHDPVSRMRLWIEENGYATASELDAIDEKANEEAEEASEQAFAEMKEPFNGELAQLKTILDKFSDQADKEALQPVFKEIDSTVNLSRKPIASAAHKALEALRDSADSAVDELKQFYANYYREGKSRYGNHLLASDAMSPLHVKEVAKKFSDSPKKVDGRQIIQEYFDILIGRDPRVFVVGEDVGFLGGVNLEFEGLNEKHGELRVTDTGIREATILGQGIGAAMRGLRPVVDIQYLDYLLYCLQPMSDDLATLRYRTAGGQSAPVIVRTKGHRLEGIWHTGSPIQMILGSIRGMHFCVPRDMVQAAGMYNTLMQGDDPALVIEVLNGYRVKEQRPENLGEYTVPLGVPETLRSGNDVTLVTYGANCRIAMEAAKRLEKFDISLEVIDVQTLIPFDTGAKIRASLEKTNAIIFFDEDVPGGATSYMMQQVLEVQNGYDYLDAAPRTLSAAPHRAAYANDGDYFSKPNLEDLVKLAYEMMREREPASFPEIF